METPGLPRKTSSSDLLIEVFDQARAHPRGPERDHFLAKRLKDDPGLLAQVALLLEAHEEAGEFLSNPVSLLSLPATEAPGETIDRYKLLELIGEGGCGLVYMAEQSEPVRRRVALKIIKLGMDTRHFIARFAAERQALALMDHPNIARVFDGGATNSGRPYFVMELVRGVKITEHCDQHHLSTEARLALFLQVCRAIQHAHQKGVIHRDIKPSNILVTQYDGIAVPKVIDFGIAKAMAGPLTDRTLFTSFAHFIGTPAYMSPEQAQMSAIDIDTRSDIYSLGVLFYELLTGSPPFDPGALFNSGLDEFRRIIRESEPPTPSRCVETLNQASLKAVAGLRSTEAPRLVHLLRRDLDWIAMKCLEKERARRYETVNDLVLDIERHLNNEPVLACPPSAGYRLRKLAIRHRGAFATAVALGLAALLALGALAVNNHLVTHERDQKESALELVTLEKQRADANLSRARDAVKQYLVKLNEDPLLQTADFQKLRRELLQSAVAFYEEFVRQDYANAELELERGRAYDDLGYLRQNSGEEERALDDYAQAQNIFQRLLNEFPERQLYRRWLAEVSASRGSVLKDLGRLDSAELVLREALALLIPILVGSDASPEVVEIQARIQGSLGTLLKEAGRIGDAEPLLRQAVATRTSLLEQTPESLPRRGRLATSWLNLGALLHDRQETGAAERAFETVLEILSPLVLQRVTGASGEPMAFQHQRAQAWNNLGMMRNAAGQTEAAEHAYRQSLEIKEKLAQVFPSVPQYRLELASSLNNLGALLRVPEGAEEALSTYLRAVQIYERLIAEAPTIPGYAVNLAGTCSNLGRLFDDWGRPEESLRWLQRSKDLAEVAFQKDPRMSKARVTLTIAEWTSARLLVALKRPGEALAHWDRAIEVDDGRYQDKLRLKRAATLATLRDHLRAAAEVRVIAEALLSRPEELYDAACVYALCVEAVAGDALLGETYAQQALALLQLAVAAGFADAEQMNTDPDLESIRSRTGFAELRDGIPPSRGQAQDTPIR